MIAKIMKNLTAIFIGMMFYFSLGLEQRAFGQLYDGMACRTGNACFTYRGNATGWEFYASSAQIADLGNMLTIPLGSFEFANVVEEGDFPLNSLNEVSLSATPKFSLYSASNLGNYEIIITPKNMIYVSPGVFKIKNLKKHDNTDSPYQDYFQINISLKYGSTSFAPTNQATVISDSIHFQDGVQTKQFGINATATLTGWPTKADGSIDTDSFKLPLTEIFDVEIKGGSKRVKIGAISIVGSPVNNITPPKKKITTCEVLGNLSKTITFGLDTIDLDVIKNTPAGTSTTEGQKVNELRLNKCPSQINVKMYVDDVANNAQGKKYLENSGGTANNAAVQILRATAFGDAQDPSTPILMGSNNSWTLKTANCTATNGCTNTLKLRARYFRRDDIPANGYLGPGTVNASGILNVLYP